MRSSYKPIGRFIRLVKTRNAGLEVTELRGIRINKEFMPSVANVIGTDLGNYKVVRQNQFAYNPMHVGRDGILPIARLDSEEPVIVSPAYVVFEIRNTDELLPEYLMMWCRRPEFDRQAWFTTDSSVRGGFDWKDFCEMEMPVPSPEKQREIVAEYETVVKRIALNEKLGRKLEETAQAIYKHWFVDFEFPMSAEDAKKLGKPELEGKPYQSSGGEMVFCDVLQKEIPPDWNTRPLNQLTSKIGSGSTPTGGKGAYMVSGKSLVRSMNVFDFDFDYTGLAFIDDKQSSKLRGAEVFKGDILINITGVSVTRCCAVPESILPAFVNQHVMILRPQQDSHLANYLVCLLCSTEYKQKLLGDSEAGSTRQALSKADLDGFHILVPPSDLLEKFERIADNVLGYKQTIGLSCYKSKALVEMLLSGITKVSA